MGLETGNYLSDLVETNPVSGDKKSAGDDHFRLIKSVLKNTFPNAAKAFYFPDTATKTTDYTVLSSDMNRTLIADTSGGELTFTLPVLGTGDAGWECSFIKPGTSTNAYYIVPTSGTIQSGEVTGLSKVRRCVPGRKTRVFWTGTVFIAERTIGPPVGSVLEFAGSTLPVGYEWPNGQTLAAASYPEYNTVRGGTSTPDRRGRIAVANDVLGLSAAGRVTTAGSNVDGATHEATGGAQNVQLTANQNGQHSHGVGSLALASQVVTDTGGAGTDANSPNVTRLVSQTKGVVAITGSTADSGLGTAHTNMPPVIVENFVLVVE